jgi:hypothetical protein
MLKFDEALTIAKATTAEAEPTEVGSSHYECRRCHATFYVNYEHEPHTLCVACAYRVADELAEFVQAALGASWECGYDEPRVYGDTVLDDCYGQLTRDESRAIAAAHARCALSIPDPDEANHG